MGKQSRVRHEPPEFLRAWRESLGLSRQAVANKIGTLRPEQQPVHQATVAKWETGETAVRVEDLKLLAEVYGITPDRLFFAPGDDRTPHLMMRAYNVLTSRDPGAVERWLELGESIAAPDKSPKR